jgi:hypothetical protein
MLKDVIARNKAAEALGITIGVSRHWLSDGWPETISIKTLAKWQYPNDIASQDALIRTVKGLVASGRLPRRYVEPDYFAADNPPLSPWDVDDWFKRQNVEPCEHIKAWIDAAQPATEQKPNKQLIEWLNKAPAERGEFTDDMLEGVRVYEIIPPIIPYDDWLNRKQITLEEALMLSLGLNPDDLEDKDPLFFPYDEYRNRRDRAMQLAKSGLLHIWINREEKDRDYYVKPLEFFRLAMNNDWLDPLNAQLDPIIAFLEWNQAEIKTAAVSSGADNFSKGPQTERERKVEKRKKAFWDAVKDKKINPERDTLPKVHMTLKSLDSDLWPKSFDGFKDWRDKYLPDLKIKTGRKRQLLR